MLNYKVGIIGRFGIGENLLNGQTIKTKSLLTALEKKIGSDSICCVDTYGGAKVMFRLPFQCLWMTMKCKNIVILPAHKGVRIIVPLLAIINTVFHRKLHYVVIGSWLNNLIKNKWILTKSLKKFDWIYAETSSMKQKLEDKGFINVVQMSNFKDLTILSESELSKRPIDDCRLCIFSRIMREKGIETALNAIISVNAKLNKPYYSLDIYGQVDAKEQIWFNQLQKTFPEYVNYCGEVPFAQSVSVLKKYDALLFPTEFFTEGIPGTIIDAYAAGVPVIASKWENFSDIINEKTGFGYEFNNKEGLINILLDLEKKSGDLLAMRSACLNKAYQYTPEAVMPVLISRLS